MATELDFTVRGTRRNGGDWGESGPVSRGNHYSIPANQYQEGIMREIRNLNFSVKPSLLANNEIQ